MLYVIYRGGVEGYKEGKSPIVHLRVRLHDLVKLAEQTKQRWAFTLSNAASEYFEDRCALEDLDQIDWNAINAKQWNRCKENKQAEFLIETSVPWSLVRAIGAYDTSRAAQVGRLLPTDGHRPKVKAMPEWYY